MIKIPHKQGLIAEKDQKKVPKNYVAKHSNGKEWIFFETADEYEKYKLDNFPKQEIIEE